MNARTLAGLLGVALVVGEASAQNLIVNGSFELGPDLPCGWSCLSSQSNDLVGWTIDSGTIDRCNLGGDCPVSEVWRSIEGLYSLDLSGCGQAGVISQVIPAVPSTRYVLRFQLSANCSSRESRTVHVSVGQETREFSKTGPGGDSPMWSKCEFSFVAGAASQLIRFASEGNGWNGPVIDDVSVIVAPTIAGILPVSGPSDGGTSVNILGDNFGPSPIVTFGGVQALTVTRFSAQKISAVTPPNLPGVVPVSVDGVVAENAFYYRPECGSDLDQNGTVDAGDISIILLDFGPCYQAPLAAPATEVPPLLDAQALPDAPRQR